MLPSDLLIHRYNGEEIIPKKLELDSEMLDLASEIIGLFAACQGEKRAELDDRLLALEGEATNYRVKRGLAHLLSNGFCEFETISPLDPPLLR